MKLNIDRVIETVLYVRDIERADAFYQQVLQLPAMVANERFRAYNVGEQSVLLLFIEGDSLKGAHYPEGYIPPHDGNGPLHIGLAVAKEQLPHWERHLTAHNIEIEGRMTWGHGGESIYFRDPDGHLLELVTPGIWANY
ncbi:VOC family protein [Serratia plymuthica]|uniref:Glyoxalase n=1 Tax=Serratia plymuthica S13 TaxID=1348660 RepID=S4YL85_SERPL|nr:VOC family protein [Serratia plymuthica]AGP45286.1 glyoxalase [Serratia plymuthica S13]ANJ94939.1 glyoxalase [Serratia plymuthica]ANJ99604.1 glyoxalase [Serratia plymuthica]EKF63234.1 glyoxalase/bleomycin resistance protein/dioxygenase [Serratia plymuthica A30]KYG17982.1 fosfomycin resistance protein FosB [Serratia plymuthica]